MGELIQIDGSEHLWFVGRGPRCPLLVYIEDATSRLMHLQFAFYSDKHGVFRVNRKDAIGGDGMTQFGRALHALNIDIICANSSQAKGRVERANGTLQDRLVNYPASILSWPAMRSAGLYGEVQCRFAKVPLDDRDVHRTLVIGHDDFDDTFAWKEERTVSVNLTLQYDQVLFILEPTGIAPIAGAEAGHGD